MTQSLRLKIATFGARNIVLRSLKRTGTPEEAATSLERASKLFFKQTKGLHHTITRPGSVTLNWLHTGKYAAGKVLLYLHGGAYMAGSAETHKGMLARISKLAGVQICAPDYRLLQEAPFPAAFDDACEAWAQLRKIGYQPADIVLGGDSAGGGLMLALLADLTQRSERPAGAFALSPWTDLTMAGESLHVSTEAVLPVSRIEEAADMFLAGADRNDPRASPLFAKFDAPPPVLIQVGAQEALADDARRMAIVLRDFGGEVMLDEWDTALHVFQILDGWVPESRRALRQIAKFVQSSFASESR